MRDIVATIQPEQDVIVRSDLAASVCVQGAPGTGKTAVGLHRAAFLLYSHRDQLSRQGVLVVGPNASFLRYIGDVLPALGEIDAQQTTIEGLVGATLARLNAKYAVRGADAPPSPSSRATPGSRSSCTGRCGRASGRPPRGCWCRAAHDAGGSRRTRWRRSSPSCAGAGSGTAPPAGCSPQRLAHADPGQDGDRRRLPRRPGAGRGRPQPRGEAVRRPGVARGRPGPAGAAAARATPTSSPTVADGVLDRGRAGAAAAGTSRPGARRRRAGPWRTRC